MKRLTEIGRQTKTDKAHYHLFTEFYNDIFEQYKSPRILEIGVLNSASIDMYLKFFEKPYVVGADVFDKSHLTNGNWKFIQGDQSRVEDLARIVKGEELFDIILDDGGHTMKQQQITFGFLIDYVKPGGCFIIEDLHTSFRPEYIEKDCEFTTYDMLQMIKKGQRPFSNYISLEQQAKILQKIESVEIFAKNPNILTDSVTSIVNYPQSKD